MPQWVINEMLEKIDNEVQTSQNQQSSSQQDNTEQNTTSSQDEELPPGFTISNGADDNDDNDYNPIYDPDREIEGDIAD